MTHLPPDHHAPAPSRDGRSGSPLAGAATPSHVFPPCTVTIDDVSEPGSWARAIRHSSFRPTLGVDRAGDPETAILRPDGRQREGAAVSAGYMLAKVGNGAPFLGLGAGSSFHHEGK